MYTYFKTWRKRILGHGKELRETTNKKKRTGMKRRLIYIIVSMLAMTACGEHRPHVDTSDTRVEISIEPFYQEMFADKDGSYGEKAKRLEEKYGEYFETYCSKEIRIGVPGEEGFENELERFMTYAENKEVIATCDSVYAKYAAKEGEKLSEALSYMKHYLKGAIIPERAYCHFSAFNNKIFVDSAYISISIEHYLGSECRYYPWLEIPMYARKGKNPENMAMDITKALIYANYPDMSEKDDVLSAMIYQGKVLYVASMCLPDEKMWRIMGMTEDELEWCKKAEKQMWGYMAEQKLLYSTNPLDKNKLTNETPFTVFFGDKSPGRAALWCGLRIVESYMESHEGTTLEELMEMGDAQTLLTEAKYRP